MSRINLLDLKFEQLSISRQITDGMWSFDIDIDLDYPYPKLWEPVEAIRTDDAGNRHCLFVGFPISRQKVVRDGDEYNHLSGVSYGWYLNRPLRPSHRLMQSTVSGSTITMEDPISYLDRLVFASNTYPCGLKKGYWDASTLNWGTSTLPGMQFEGNENSTIQSQLDDIMDYAGLIHYDHWKLQNASYQPVSYLINEANLDTHMDLPVPLILTSDSNEIDARTHRMIEDIQSTEEGDKWKNRVYVDATIQNVANTWYSAVLPATWDIAENGLERAYQYCEELPPGTSAAAAQNWASTRAKAIYSLLCTPTTTFEVPFWYKYDLQLYQKIQFLGYPSIPEDQMRITEIQHRFNDSEGDVCSVRCAMDRQWSSARKLALILKQDSIALMDSIAKIIDKKSQTSFLGTITSTSNGSAVYVTKSGSAGYAATPNQ